MIKRFPFILFLFLPVFVLAIAPQFWEQNTQQNFAGGDPQAVSITSDGELLLAPQLKKIYEGPDSILWKIVRDKKNNLFAASGNDGKIIRLDATGKSSVLLDTDEFEVQALTIDKDDILYAATSPDGKIYRIKPDGTSAVFFDPPEKYIWSLALDPEGNLYAGTGDQGRIYRIDRAGSGKLLADTSETNITVLSWDRSKNLLAGTDRNGILYSIDASGRIFVLFDSELQQITSIYSDSDGAIYFAAISGVVPAPELRPQQETQPQPGQRGNASDSNPNEGEGGEVSATVEVPTIQALQPPLLVRPSGASELYRILPDGSVEDVYTAPEDQILDISEFKDGMLILSTGKKAKLISLDKQKKSTIMLKAPEEQITSILRGEKTWIATANPGNIYELVEDHSSAGTFYSDIKDSETPSTWGQITWKAAVPQDTALRLSSRSGNTKTPDETWSSWQDAGSDPAGKQMGVPRARFAQWKADFSTTNAKITPVLRGVRIAYLQQNIRPEIVSITVHPPGIAFRKGATLQDGFAGMTETVLSAQDQADLALQAQAAFGPQLGKREYRNGFQTITWSAADQNQDELRFDVYYKDKGDKNWKELAKDLRESIFTWDTQTIPDGTYTVKIAVSDNGSNPQGYALRNETESSPFDVDNSAPTIEVVTARSEQGTTVLEVRAQDQFSAIKEMFYSAKPGVWNTIFPVDTINDSQTETYRIELNSADVTEIVLRCSDQVNNASTIKYTLH